MSDPQKREWSKNILFVLFVIPLVTVLVTEAQAVIRDKPLNDHVQERHTQMLEQILNQNGTITSNQAVMKTEIDNLKQEVYILRGIK